MAWNDFPKNRKHKKQYGVLSPPSSAAWQALPLETFRSNQMEKKVKQLPSYEEDQEESVGIPFIIDDDDDDDDARSKPCHKKRKRSKGPFKSMPLFLFSLVLLFVLLIMCARIVYEIHWSFGQERQTVEDALSTLAVCDEIEASGGSSFPHRLNGGLDVPHRHSTQLIAEMCQKAALIVEQGAISAAIGRAFRNVWPCPSSDPACLNALLSTVFHSWIMSLALCAFAIVVVFGLASRIVLLAFRFLEWLPLPSFGLSFLSGRCSSIERQNPLRRHPSRFLLHP